jgi:predicted membrane protein
MRLFFLFIYLLIRIFFPLSFVLQIYSTERMGRQKQTLKAKEEKVMVGV